MAEQQSFFGQAGGGWHNDEMERARAGGGPRRFWLPPDDGKGGGKGKGVFLDGIPFFLFEHQLKIGDSWQNWFACLQNWEEPCDLCDAGDDPDYVGMLTIMSLYQNKKQEWQANRQLFPMKQRAFKVIQDLANARGGDLTRWVVRISRTADRQSPSIGDVYDFQRQIPDEATLIRELRPFLLWIEQLQPRNGRKLTIEDYVKPYNYLDVFKKPDAKDLIRVARRLRYTPLREAGGSDRPGPPSGDVPF